jgi:hypothetical protein
VWLGGVVLDALKYVVLDLDRTFTNDLWTLFSDLFGSPVAVLSDPWVQWFIKLSVSIGVAALPVVIAYHGVRRTLDTLDGTEVMPAGVLVRRSLTAGAVLTGVALYGWFAATLADYLRDLLGALPLNIALIHAFFFVDEHTSKLAALCIFLMFLIGAGLVVVQRAILSAEFTVLMIIGAFLALGRVADDRPAPWLLWKREVVACCITPVLQLLLIYLCMIRLGGIGDPASFARWLQAFAMLYLLWNTPRWARQFTYAVGGGGGVGGMAAGVTAGVTRLVMMRTMWRR